MSGWATAISASCGMPFFNDRLFSLSEDLILAEERTTERDRKKITEGETRACCLLLQALILLWSKSCYPPPPATLLNHAASERAGPSVAPFIIYARFGWQRPAQRASKGEWGTGEGGRKEGALCLLPALPALARLICKWDSAPSCSGDGKARGAPTMYHHFPRCTVQKHYYCPPS